MEKIDASERQQLVLNTTTRKYIATQCSEPLKQPDDDADSNLLNSHDTTSLAEVNATGS